MTVSRMFIVFQSKFDKNFLKKGGLKMYTASDLAKYIIYECSNERQNPISNLQLQKILYYIQGYFYKRFDIPAFEDKISCWTFGPVVPEVYFEYNIYGANKITNYLDEDSDEIIKISNNRDYKKCISSVIGKCLRFSPSQLVEKTHSETPWKKAEASKTISESNIRNYFLRNDPLGLENK